MNLSTHFIFALALGTIFFGKPELVLLLGLGALLPDLDREYWFVRVEEYRDEQMHRARLHNVFALAVMYLVNPFLSLGMLFHLIQDSFTTAKDRGVEWFYPLTRLVKKGLRDEQGQVVIDPATKGVYFYQEDLRGIIENADPDLRIPGAKSVPWRRVYGFALNGQVLDNSFLVCSLALFVMPLLVPDLSRLYSFIDYFWANAAMWSAGYAGIAFVYVAGEMDRNDKVTKLYSFRVIKKPILFAGVLLLMAWGFFFRSEIWSNLLTLAVDYEVLIASIIAVVISLIGVFYWEARKTQAVI